MCGNMSSISSNFWWGEANGQKKVHWIVWDKMCTRKHEGGLGFRDPEAFNQALLAKQAWRVLQVPTSLCARVLKAWYFKDDTILSDTCPSSGSYTFRSILHGRDFLREGLIWRVGSGESINIHHDPWIPRGQCRKPTTPQRRNDILCNVSDPINPVDGDWDEDLIKQTFNEEDAWAILQIPIHEGQEDYVAWHFDKKGIFSVKSAYKVAVDSIERDSRHG